MIWEPSRSLFLGFLVAVRTEEGPLEPAVAAGAWAAGSCGESVGVGGAGARQVGGGEGHTGRRVMRRPPRLQVCGGGPDARGGERGVARTGVGPGGVPGSCVGLGGTGSNEGIPTRVP